MELTLDLMEHQVIGVLTRDDNAWSRAWMGLVPRITRRLSRRGASAENGVRFAARQLVLTCDLVDTPPIGAVPEAGTAWGNVLAAMEADPALAPIAAMLRAEIEGETIPVWEQAAQMLGIPLAVVNQLGVMPTLDLAGDPVAVRGVVLDEDGRTWTLESQIADEQGV